MKEEEEEKNVIIYKNEEVLMLNYNLYTHKHTHFYHLYHPAYVYMYSNTIAKPWYTYTALHPYMYIVV